MLNISRQWLMSGDYVFAYSYCFDILYAKGCSYDGLVCCLISRDLRRAMIDWMGDNGVLAVSPWSQWCVFGINHENELQSLCLFLILIILYSCNGIYMCVCYRAAPWDLQIDQ